VKQREVARGTELCEPCRTIGIDRKSLVTIRFSGVDRCIGGGIDDKIGPDGVDGALKAGAILQVGVRAS
jgi:hypothetical protein